MKKDLNSVSIDLTHLFSSSELFLIEDALAAYSCLKSEKFISDLSIAFYRAARWEKHFNKTDRDV